MTAQDRSVFSLIDVLKKDPSNKDAAETLKAVYDSAVETKREMIRGDLEISKTPDTWAAIVPDLEILQKMYNDIKANPAALKAVPEPTDFSKTILKVKNKAAEGYYNQGIEYLNYNNRSYAKMAYDAFSKANRMVPGYNDVVNRMRIALDLSVIKVIVQPVDYYNYGYNYWGFSNDYLQRKMVDDLNRMSFSDVKFYTDWDARSRQIKADRIVTLRMTNIYIGNMYTERYSYTRSKEIEVGQTRTLPPKPIYETVKATVNVTRRIMKNYGSLECRIYDAASGANILFDNYPSDYRWAHESATYTGDSRALLPEDWDKINNKYQRPPSRTELSERIINDAYDPLLRRIRSGVNFGM